MDYIKENRLTFVQWVCRRKAHDNPRGDFIRDTRDLVRMKIPESEIEGRMQSESSEANAVYRRLRREYDQLCCTTG